MSLQMVIGNIGICHLIGLLLIIIHSKNISDSKVVSYLYLIAILNNIYERIDIVKVSINKTI